jgi:large subunit ribosomal protein L25
MRRDATGRREGDEIATRQWEEWGMAEQLTVTVRRRSVLGKRVKRLRREGIIPANLYGRKLESQALELDAAELRRLLLSNARTRVIRLSLDGKEEPALLRHIARRPSTGHVQHLDFVRVELTETVRARVALRLTGEAPAVRVLGGTLLHMADTLEIECMAQDLPEALEADVGVLDQLDSTLHARDVPLPRGVTLLADPDEPVAKIEAPRKVEEAAPAAAAEAATPSAEAASEAGAE